MITIRSIMQEAHCVRNTYGVISDRHRYDAPYVRSGDGVTDLHCVVLSMSGVGTL